MTQDTGHHPSIQELRVGTVVIGERYEDYVRGGRRWLVVSHLVEEGWREGLNHHMGNKVMDGWLVGWLVMLSCFCPRTVLVQSVNHASVEVGR